MRKTYSLRLEGEFDSDSYYREILIPSEEVKEMLRENVKEYVEAFMEFIKANKIESLRTFEEYGLELLMIGVLFNEYIDNARAFTSLKKMPFNYLNKQRVKKIKANKNYHKIDVYRGMLSNKILLKKVEGRNHPNIEGLIKLKDWLEATNEFEEEVIRINNWINFLQSVRSNLAQNILFMALQISDKLYQIGEKYLWKYTKYLYSFLEAEKCKKSKKEDVFLRTKGEIQYYFNMVAAEILNQVYSNEFKKCADKVMFLPSCMRQPANECQSILTSKGYRCRACGRSCNIYKLDKIAKEKNMMTYIVPHESSLFKLINYERKKGLIGIACVPKLYSGGLKAIRLGYIPQCMPLDFSGCKAHWQERDIMTTINFKVFEEKF
ncbi:DUF116 domain-containing protein [Clostridium sp. MSJ-8]|uniref:DUF116 domain-containing protein n=1 Tax=Clostridium sp. MSJ-8 TaxID=2841510 RepID=UPI001C0EAC24|nr:DUF116 domain-containing protein [Clostridium sp. MSJ-8]MBU5487614.1 DUF116 domain-containing protein [Clostridium sp. MSJ-8]